MAPEMLTKYFSIYAGLAIHIKSIFMHWAFCSMSCCLEGLLSMLLKKKKFFRQSSIPNLNSQRVQQ